MSEEERSTAGARPAAGPVSRSWRPLAEPPRLPAAVAFAVTLAISAFTVWLRSLADPLLGDRFPFLAFFWAILFAGWLGGWGPAMVATLALAGAARWLWMVPTGSLLPLSSTNLTALALFVLTGMFISLLSESWRRTIAARDAARAELEARAARERHGGERLRLALESTPAGMFLVDEAGRIVFGNDAVQQLLGYSAAELVGMPVEALVPPAMRDRHPEYRRRFAAEARRRPMGSGRDLYALRKDGSEVPVEIGLSPFEASGERFVIAAVTDVSLRRRALELERQAARESERANQSKDDFLSVLSHELRTPLNATLGWASLLADGRLDEESKRQAADAIVRNARAEARLVDSLLDLSRIMAGKLQVDLAPMDAAKVVRAAAENLRPEAQAKGVQFEVSVPATPVEIVGDEARVQQIVWNLASNAIKYTTSGGHVRVSLAASADRATIEVRDTGRGIGADFLPRVFDRFAQESRGDSRTRVGLGLGLAITQELALLHGGEVRAASPGENQGSVFTVELPIGHRPTTALRRTPPTTPPPPTRGAVAGLDVLVVEDDGDARALIARTLATHGARVRTAPSAAAAYAEFLQRRPQVLLADLRMPEEDGFMLLARLRALPPEPGELRWAAAALTAEAGDGVRRAALEAGFDAYLAKPASPAALVRLVAELAGRRAATGDSA
jgi:PAS domain S-box-containing protein